MTLAETWAETHPKTWAETYQHLAYRRRNRQAGITGTGGSDVTAFADLFADVRQQDREWQKKADVPELYLPWMPADVAQYLVLLIEAMVEAPGLRLLEVGCGPGTKMMLARDLFGHFGLRVSGFDRVPEYVEAAVKNGLDAQVCDAFDFAAYNRYDIVFFNRPFRDRALERDLEKLVFSKVRRGAVVICMNLEDRPPQDRYLVVTDDDFDATRRGVWLKL